jgi:hypothetical protein
VVFGASRRDWAVKNSMTSRRQRAQSGAAIGGVPRRERTGQVQVTAGHRRLHAALA